MGPQSLQGTGRKVDPKTHASKAKPLPCVQAARNALAQQSQQVLKVLLHPEPQAFTFDMVAGEAADQDAIFRGAALMPGMLLKF